MSTPEKLTTALESVVGKAYLLTDAAVLDYAVDGVLPRLVVCPEDEAQIAAVMRLTNEYQATVFPRGGGSHTALGQTPTRVDVVLSLQRLQRLLAYEPADMTTTVQAGLRLADLQRTLVGHRQQLALDPPAAATTTVGGMVAANMSGPRRLLYGTARDLLLGIAVITADGTRAKAGGRVVKNVTGYDLNKLYIGSLGTLAVIVELTFKVHPLPPGEATLGIGFSRQADMLAMLRTTLELPLRLSSLELLNAAAAVALSRRAGIPAPETDYLLIARVEGPSAAMQKQVQRLVAALQMLPAVGSLAVQMWDEREQACLWREIEEFPVAMHAQAPQGVMNKVSVQVTDMPALCQEVAKLSPTAGAAWPVLAHAGSGIAYVHIPPGEHTSADPAPMLAHLRALDACIARWRGHRVIERAPVAVKRHCQVWGPPRDDFALMRAIKATFDPHHRLNPGRFIGGL
jgi:glycolate oxidase FAD binding subunit